MLNVPFNIATLFATGAEDGTVILWSVNSLSAIKKFEGTKDEFNDSMTLSQSTTSSTSVTPIVTMGPSTSVNHILILCQVSTCTCKYGMHHVHVWLKIRYKR